MKSNPDGIAIYLAGHGTLSRPRLIELQYRRILRYREALGNKYEKHNSDPELFFDLTLPRLSGGLYLDDVPAFRRLLDAVTATLYRVVYIDIDETSSFAPRYQTGFVRHLLESAGAKVLSAFYDDEKALEQVLKERFGERAKPYEVTDSSDLVAFFPALAGDIALTAIQRELDFNQNAALSKKIGDRVYALQKKNAYAGGRTPFIEDRLLYEWARQS